MGQLPYATIPPALQQDEETASFIEDVRKLLGVLQLYGATVLIRDGNGSPEGVLVANKGSLYLRRDGGAGTTFYVKESGDGLSTGWVGK